MNLSDARGDETKWQCKNEVFPELTDALAGSLQTLHPFQVEIAEALVREEGVSLAAARKLATSTFEDSIVMQFSNVLDEVLKERGADPFEIVERLAKGKSQMSRWKRKVTKPSWKTYCLALAAFDARFGPEFPSGRTVVVQAIADTLPALNAFSSGKRDGHIHTSDEVVMLHYASVSIAYRNAAFAKAEADQSQDKRRIDEIDKKLSNAAIRIIDRARREGIRWSDNTYSAIARLLGRWTKAWCIFHYVIRYNWKYWE